MDWLESIEQEINQNGYKEIKEACKIFEKNARGEASQILEEVEGNVNSQFTADSDLYIMKPPEIKSFLEQIREPELYYFALALQLHLIENPEDRHKIREILNEQLERILEEIAEQDLLPFTEAATFNTEKFYIVLKNLPQSNIEENILLQPLYENATTSREEVKGIIAHEMTHAYLKQETGINTASANINTTKGKMTTFAEAAGDLNDSTKLDSEMLAVNEAAAHVSGRIFSPQDFHARNYEIKEGMKREDAHKAVYLFKELIGKYGEKGRQMAKIREAAARSIEHKDKKSERHILMKTIQEKVSKIVPSISNPDSAIGHLQLIVNQEVEDFDSKEYEQIGLAASKLQQAESLTMNFFSNVSWIDFNHQAYKDLGVERFFPTEGSKVINSDKEVADDKTKFLPPKDEELELIHPEEFEKLVNQLDHIPEAKGFQKDLRELENACERESQLGNLLRRNESDYQNLEEDLEEFLLKSFDAKHTDPKTIEESEKTLEEHLKTVIERREKILKEGISICEKIVQLEKDLDEKERKALGNTDEEDKRNLEKLINLTETNAKIAAEWKKILEKAIKLLKEARESIQS